MQEKPKLKAQGHGGRGHVTAEGGQAGLGAGDADVAVGAEVTVSDLFRVVAVAGSGHESVISKGRIVFIKSYGYAVAENRTPLTPGTVMYGASLTKATFAWMLMQLVDEGKVDLDKPISQYLAKPLPDYDGYADLTE